MKLVKKSDKRSQALHGTSTHTMKREINLNCKSLAKKRKEIPARIPNSNKM